jgi:5-methylcytosine-specific restriction endonuclease McrA
MSLAEDIHALRKDGMSYNQIRDQLNCSKGTICYHLGKGQKEKNQARRNQIAWYNQRHVRRINSFMNAEPKEKKESRQRGQKSITEKACKFQTREGGEMKFNYRDVYQRYGDKFECALTGRPLTWNEPREYQYDHIIPIARGGDNSMKNLQIVCNDANKAKHDLLPQEFLDLCKEVLVHAGYRIYKPSGSYWNTRYLQ